MDLKASVTSKVQEFVDNQKTFTAFDITQELRTVDPGNCYLHHEVRPIVHDYMANIADYDNNRDFDLHQDGPIVYTCIATPPVDANPVGVIPATLDTPTPTPPTDWSKDIVEVRLTSRNRLNIPKALTDWLKQPQYVSCLLRNHNVSIVNMTSDMAGSYGKPKESILKTDKYFGFKLGKVFLDKVIDTSKPLFIEKKKTSYGPELIIRN